MTSTQPAAPLRLARLHLENWRSFRVLDVEIGSRLFLVGGNASGKSNLLDGLHFLGDVAVDGLQSAVRDRGSVFSLVNFSAGGRPLVLETVLTAGDDEWQYRLELDLHVDGRGRTPIRAEQVTRNGEVVLSRPGSLDDADAPSLVQTHLEQMGMNTDFRPVADFFASVRYFHPVPQAMRAQTPLSRRNVADPYGGTFIEDLARIDEDTRERRLARVRTVLAQVVPGMEHMAWAELPGGSRHLLSDGCAASPSTYTEESFSDGTLRLVGMLWQLAAAAESAHLLLLEEPEISLQPAVVRQLPGLLAGALGESDGQVIMSTHSPQILDDETVGADQVLVLDASTGSSRGLLLSDISAVTPEIEAGLPLSDAVESLSRPRLTW